MLDMNQLEQQQGQESIQLKLSQGQRPACKSNNGRTRLWETTMCVCPWVRWRRKKKGVCVGTIVCFLCICADCVFVLKEDLSKSLVFQCEISVDNVASTDYE